MWSRDGNEVFFSDTAGDLYSVSISGGGRLGTPQLLFKGKPLGISLQRGFDVSLDGQDFLVIKTSEDSQLGLTLTQNWFAEFEDKVR